ncbi:MULTISPECIES: TetR/AcrR family transcriptional regulator [Psychrobacter]|uniref:TetR/AcrR family transcriptional regulator n=1 Tax=Psychrobacter TaxID=497 RepID=UPI0004064DD6|nr:MULTISPECIES: TetR/AcrR family transcriptional regulator [Psychrobacter]
MKANAKTDFISADDSATTETKRELAKAKTRRALLKSALQLYRVEGACGMSMNKVAKGAGIAQPSFYNHFASLEALQQELGAQLKENYLSPMRMAWIDMLKDYPRLTKAQFNERCQHCLNMIFDAAFQNIALFQRLLEDRLRFAPSIKEQDLLNECLLTSDSKNPAQENNSLLDKGLGNLMTEIQEEWTAIFIKGLSLSGCSFERSEVNLCVDIAAAQVHELIVGCHQQRYSRQQAISMLSTNFDALFSQFFTTEWQEMSG